MHLRHHKHESFGRGLGLTVNGDQTFELDKRGLVDQRLRLRIDRIGGIRIRDCSNRSRLLGHLSCVVEFDVSFGGVAGSIVCALLGRLLRFLVFLLVWWRHNTPASFPGCPGSKSYTSPVFVCESCALHDHFDVVQEPSLACNQRSSIGFLEGSVFKHGETNACRPLSQGAV